MHPDYLDFIEKRKIRPRATWFDLKNLCRKLFDVRREDCRVSRVVEQGWNGWLLEFACDIDMQEFKRNVWGVLQIGERAVFVSITNA